MNNFFRSRHFANKSVTNCMRSINYPQNILNTATIEISRIKRAIFSKRFPPFDFLLLSRGKGENEKKIKVTASRAFVPLYFSRSAKYLKSTVRFNNSLRMRKELICLLINARFTYTSDRYYSYVSLCNALKIDEHVRAKILLSNQQVYLIKFD